MERREEKTPQAHPSPTSTARLTARTDRGSATAAPAAAVTADRRARAAAAWHRAGHLSKTASSLRWKTVAASPSLFLHSKPRPWLA